MTLNIVPFALCLLFTYRCIYSFWTLYEKFTVELQTGYWILFCKILPQSYVVVAVHSLTVCTLYSLHIGDLRREDQLWCATYNCSWKVLMTLRGLGQFIEIEKSHDYHEQQQ